MASGAEARAGVLEIDLADLVVPRQISVVQDLDLGKLQQALGAILAAVNARSSDGERAPSREEFASLQRELEALKESSAQKDSAIKELMKQQVRVGSWLTDRRAGQGRRRFFFHVALFVLFGFSTIYFDLNGTQNNILEKVEQKADKSDINPLVRVRAFGS